MHSNRRIEFRPLPPNPGPFGEQIKATYEIDEILFCLHHTKHSNAVDIDPDYILIGEKRCSIGHLSQQRRSAPGPVPLPATLPRFAYSNRFRVRH
jgi:hypothetical protein